ncbi:MAG: helix-turn-helix domain-containing protein [Sphingobium sp.]
MIEQPMKIVRGEVPPKPLYGAQPVGDPILDAAAVCIQRKGFDNTSLEEVASEAGVSRTTLYRRFGNRESLFTSLLWARAEPFRDWTRSILSGHGTVAERLETVFTHAVLEMQRVGWLDTSIRAGISPLGMRLIKNTQVLGANEGLGLLVSTLLAARDDHGDITIEEVLEWMAQQMIALASGVDWEEGDLRQRVRFFVIPALAGPMVDRSLEQRLDAIDAKLDQLGGAVRPARCP